MTEEKLYQLAKQAGFGIKELEDGNEKSICGPEGLEEMTKPLKKFAELVAAKEREACAKVCDDLLEEATEENWAEGEKATIEVLAVEIRDRGETNTKENAKRE
jgi:hypothetical protein